MAGGTNNVLADFIAFEHFAFCPIDLGGEGDLAAFIEHAHCAHFCIFVQGFCKLDELLVLNNGVGSLLHA